MNKQTVEERYQQQQAVKTQMNIQVPRELQRQLDQQQLPKLFKQMEQALLQAHQSVQQAQAADPTQLPLQSAKQKLQYAIQQLQLLKTASPELALGLPKSTQQQLTQLNHQILRAEQTLQLIISATGPS